MSDKSSNLAARCKAYLEAGPPAHMSEYVSGSITEIIISAGAKGVPIDDELRELGEIVQMEAEGFDDAYDDPEIRAYMKRGAELVGEVLEQD